MKAALPPLDPRRGAYSNIPIPQTPGTWWNADLTLLDPLSGALQSGELDPRSQEIVSIPDIWAQVEVMRLALLAEGPMHARGQAQWRGLLALFALRANYSYKYALSTQIFQLDGPGELRRVLKRLAPKASLDKWEHWKEVGLITVNTQPVGLLVPSIIVCPARSPQDSLAEIGIPWVKGAQTIDPAVAWAKKGQLLDPTSPSLGLSKEDLLCLYWFCDTLRQDILAHANSAELSAAGPGNGTGAASRKAQQKVESIRELLDDIAREVEQFKDAALARLTAVAPGTQPEASRSAISPMPAGSAMPQSWVYDSLAKAHKIVHHHDAREYDSMLAIRADLATKCKGLILVDDNIPRALRRSGNDLHIWAGVSFDRYFDDEALRTDTNGNIADADFIVVHTADFFSDTLFLTKKQEITSQRDHRHYILPLSPLALIVMRPEQLLEPETLKVAASRDGSYVASLTVKIVNSSGKETDHTLHRLYLSNEIVEADNEDAPIALWPNFRSSNWKKYFIFYSGLLSQTFAVREVVSGSSMCKLIDECYQGTASKRELARILATCLYNPAQRENHERARRQRISGRADLLREVFLVKEPPEAVFCDTAMGRMSSPGYIPSDQRRSAGLLVMPKGVELHELTRDTSCKVGIDFGTTKTIIYSDSGEGSPMLLKFENRNLLPIFPATGQEVGILRDFLPDRSITRPFMSALRSRGDEAMGLNESVLSAAIYYVDDVQRLLEDLGERNDRLKLRLKWGMDQGDKDLVLRAQQAITLFLRQVVLQSAAELFVDGIPPQKIEWRFSYPESYSTPEYEAFVVACETAAEEAASLIESVDSDTPTILVKLLPESLSAARYFIDSHKVDLNSATVTIDVGGGSSDISVWQNNEPLLRTSIKLAGQRILIDALANNNGLLVDAHKFVQQTDDERARYEKLISRIGDGFGLQEVNEFALEMLMGNTSFGTEVISKLSNVAGFPSGILLTDIAKLALAGILYHIARLIQWLHNKHRFTTGTNQLVTICIGGRASALFRAIFRPGSERERELLELFVDAGENCYHTARLIFTPESQAKHEVAFGMLRIGQKDLANYGIIEATSPGQRPERLGILGENITIGSDRIPASHDMLPLLLSLNDKSPDWKVDDFGALHQFLAEARKHGLCEHLTLTLHEEAAIRDQVNNEMKREVERVRGLVPQPGEDAERRLLKSMPMEPVFVIVLRRLIRLLIDRGPAASAGRP